MLEERDEEDLKAALACIKVDRPGKITKVKEIDLSSTSSEVTPIVSESSSSVTLDQVKNFLAEWDVKLANLLSSKMLAAAHKQLEITNDTSPVSIAITAEVHVSQPLAKLPVSEPQHGMPLNFFW